MNQLEQNISVPKAESKNPLVQFFTRLPIFFPLIALFHIVLTGYEAVFWIGDDSVSQLYWLRPVVMLCYTVFWCAACMAQKWGGIAYVVLTVANVAFHLFGPDIILKRALGDILFVPIPVSLLFSFVLLFYFKKMK